MVAASTANVAHANDAWVLYDFGAAPFHHGYSGGDVTPFTFAPTSVQPGTSGQLVNDFQATFQSGTAKQWQVTTRFNNYGLPDPFTNGLGALTSLNPYREQSSSLIIHTNTPVYGITFDWLALSGSGANPLQEGDIEVSSFDFFDIQTSAPVYNSGYHGGRFAGYWRTGYDQTITIDMQRVYQGINYGDFAIGNLWLYTATAIPEPSNAALMLVPLILLMAARRRARDARN